MRAITTAAVLLSVAAIGWGSATPAHAAPPVGVAAGGEMPVAAHDDASEIDALHPAMVAKARSLGLGVARPEAAAVGTLQFPLRPQPSALGFQEHGISNHVDLDGTSKIKDFACGTRTYDGHKGTDLFLNPYPWTAMDRKELAIVAAREGTILAKQDGQFDRQCSTAGSPPANYVIVSQDDGLVGYYWHMKKGTVTTKPVGAHVDTGEFLGFVGSSGRTTGPHLHFEVRGSTDQAIEPAHGACNARATSWTSQAPTIDTTVVRVATHRIAPPARNSSCDDPDPGYSDAFMRGATVWFATYMRDQKSTDKPLMELVDPTGKVVSSFLMGAPSSGFYTASYWYGGYALPGDAPLGLWRARTTFQGKRYEHVFRVGGSLAKAKITAKITSARVLTLPIGTTKTVTTVVTNTSAQDAVGCFVALGRPLTVDAAHQVAGGALGEAFTVAKGASKTVSLRLTARTGFVAKATTVALHVRCTNADAAPYGASTTALVVSGP